MSRKSFWNARVFSSFCEGNRMVWCNIFCHHPPSHPGGGTTRHSNSQCQKLLGHTWKLYGCWQAPPMYAKHTVQQGYHIPHIYSFCRYSAEHISRTAHFSIRRYFLAPRTPDRTDTNTLKVSTFLNRTASFEKLKTRIREEISLIHRNI